MFARFGLVLTVTHACNLRCTYCYAGEKFRRTMPEAIGRRAIERATRSLSAGGRLELSFFGGEPLLISLACEGAARLSKELGFRAIEHVEEPATAHEAANAVRNAGGLDSTGVAP